MVSFDNGRFYFVTGSSARKPEIAKARPNATVVVDSRRIQGEEQSISSSGSVEIITGEESKEINKKIIQRYITKEGINDPAVGLYLKWPEKKLYALLLKLGIHMN